MNDGNTSTFQSKLRSFSQIIKNHFVSDLLKYQQGLEISKWNWEAASTFHPQEIDYKDPFITAIDCGHAFLVKAFIISGERIDVEVGGYDLLIRSLEKRKAEVARILLNEGFNVNGKISDSNGMRVSPIVSASTAGCLDCVKLLIEKGADVDLRDQLTEETALFAASMMGHDLIARFLLMKGANSGKRVDGLTCLMVAAYLGHLEVVKELVYAGANLREKFEETGVFEQGIFLVEQAMHWGKIKISIAEGDTAMALAKRKNRKHVISFLLAWGAQPPPTRKRKHLMLTDERKPSASQT